MVHGFNFDTEKVISNETDVCVFVNITTDNLNSEPIHHFVIKNSLEVEFNFIIIVKNVRGYARYKLSVNLFNYLYRLIQQG